MPQCRRKKDPFSIKMTLHACLTGLGMRKWVLGTPKGAIIISEVFQKNLMAFGRGGTCTTKL